MTCATAGTNRAPFDLPEAESELVAGFMTEYSGFRWSIFFMAEYTAMFLFSLLGAILFAGGWNGPVPVAQLLGLTAAARRRRPVWLGQLPGLRAICLVKGYLGVIFMMWLRWTLPRLRIDQVMTTCLKYCVPLASIMLVGAMLWMFASRRVAPASRPATSRSLSTLANCRAIRASRCAISTGSRMEAIHWHSFFFLLFALVACVFAVAVVVSSNIVRMASYLVVSLAAVAGLFFLAGADFLGAMQLMVYVGGTLVLLVFGVMLTARGPLVSMRTGGGQWIMALLVGGSLLAVLLQTVRRASSLERPRQPADRRAARRRRPRPPSWAWAWWASAPTGSARPPRRGGKPPARPATCWSSKSSPSTCWSCWWGGLSWPGETRSDDGKSCGRRTDAAGKSRRQTDDPIPGPLTTDYPWICSRNLSACRTTSSSARSCSSAAWSA